MTINVDYYVRALPLENDLARRFTQEKNNRRLIYSLLLKIKKSLFFFLII